MHEFPKVKIISLVTLPDTEDRIKVRQVCGFSLISPKTTVALMVMTNDIKEKQQAFPHIINKVFSKPNEEKKI
jgi:hypothetical protein